ncbi:MAG: hypothetical protein ABIP51_05975 [Bacteroidia bacterium]
MAYNSITNGTTSGNITAANTNLTSGTATTNSAVQLTVPDGHSAGDIYINGTFSSGTTLNLQGSQDGTNWFFLNGRRNTDAASNDTSTLLSSDFVGGASPTGANPSNWRVNIAAVKYFRVTCSIYTAADNISLTITTSLGTGTVFQNASIPTGTNIIGKVSIDQTTPGTTNLVATTPAPVLFRGRSSTFRTPGRAGTAGQKILSIHNATGSTISLTVNKISIDIVQTVIKAITVLPPIIRAWKVTVLPTNGTSLVKNKIGGTSTSNASVTVLGDASADGTGSATTLTATLPAGTILSQEFAARFITGAGYEPMDRIEFFSDSAVVLAPLEGIVIFLDYVLATQNPVTDMWIAVVDWSES